MKAWIYGIAITAALGFGIKYILPGLLNGAMDKLLPLSERAAVWLSTFLRTKLGKEKGEEVERQFQLKRVELFWRFMTSMDRDDNGKHMPKWLDRLADLVKKSY